MEMEDRPTLLIVDDNKGIVQMLDELFYPYYNILTAFNGKEAFDLCLSKMPSLVISDIIMPEMNGIELCSAIKSTEETSHIPVVLLTAKASKETQRKDFLFMPMLLQQTFRQRDFNLHRTVYSRQSPDAGTEIQ